MAPSYAMMDLGMTGQCAKCNEVLPDGARFCRQCGALVETSEAGQADPLVGRVLLDRYRVVRMLGEGGMGRVYLAEQRMGTTTRAVAVKTLRPALTDDPQVVKRFYREAETVVQLTHPNTIQFFDFGELDDGTLAIVMEYIEGQSLAELIRQGGPLDAARADRILAQVCGSLGEAHQVGIIHRDLKPDNILLTTRGGQDDFVKVLDFGIAKNNEPDEQRTQLTQQGMVVGTPPYMSPEQFSGEPLDPRSDVYSLAVVCFEMLSGQLPFEAKTAWEWASQHLTAEPRRLPVTGGDEQLDRKAGTIDRALRKAREERPEGVLEFLREFTGYDDPRMVYSGVGSVASSTGLRAASAATSAAAAPTPTEQQLPGVRRLGRWWLAAGTLALGAIAAAWLVAGDPAEEHALSARAATETGAAAENLEPTGAAASGTAPSGRSVPTAAAPKKHPETRAQQVGEAKPVARADRRARSRRAGSRSRQGETDARPALPAASPKQSAASTSDTERADREPNRPRGASSSPAVEPPELRTASATRSSAIAAAPKAATPVLPSARPGPSSPPNEPTEASDSNATTAPNPEAKAKAGQIQKLVKGNRFNQALGRYHAATNEFGMYEPALAQVRADLAEGGAREITQLLARGKCPQAQSLYRALRSARLHGRAETAFDGANCRKP